VDRQVALQDQGLAIASDLVELGMIILVEEMAQAIAAQVRRLNFYSAFVDTTNPPAVQLATKLATLAPGDLNRVFYTCSGSAANDTAVRLIHYYNARRGKPEKFRPVCTCPGQRRAKIVVIEFKDYETALTCYRSPEYTKARALRAGAADIDIIVIEGYDGPQPTD